MTLRLAAAGALAAGGLLTVGCASAQTKGQTGGSASAPLRNCAATVVRYAPAAGFPSTLARTPWVVTRPESSGIVGMLFYWGSTRWGQTHEQSRRLHIYIGGRAPGHGVHMKILWVLRHGSGHVLRVHGQRLDGAGRFAQRLDATGNGRQFPSIINIPTPGCWRITLSTATATGKVTVISVPNSRSH